MNDQLTMAAVARAQAALQTAIGIDQDSLAKKNLTAFGQLACAVAHAVEGRTPADVLRSKGIAGRALEAATKSVSAGTAAGFLGNPDGQVLAEAFLGTLAQSSIVDALQAAGAGIVPNTVRHLRVLASSGATVVNEAAPIAMQTVTASSGDFEEIRTGAIVAMTQELANSSVAVEWITRELQKAVSKASNESVLTAIVSGAGSASAGSDIQGTLKNALAALPGDSQKAVVLVSGADCKALALASEGRMPIGGGEYQPGLRIVASLEGDSASPKMIAIAADLTLIDPGQLALEGSSEASLNVADSPSGASQVVSLWQTNTRAVKCTRELRYCVPASAVVVVA